MPTVLWIPIGAIVLGVLLGAKVGSSSRSGKAGTAALIGLALAFMATFPLLAIGLADL